MARLVSLREFPDVWMYEYAAVISVVSVSAAMLLRLMGPPGTLTLFDLNQMLLPAVVSLLWAGIGALLSWLSIRKQSRTLWSLGAFLLVAWVAPFPPRASASIHHGPEAPQRNVSTHE